ncbi:MAG: lysophospholipid acyltransferase family protein [Verrucomicrobiota bacterium]
MNAETTNQKSGGPVVPRQLSWRRKVAADVALVFMRLVMKSWRVRWQDGEQCPVLPGPVIFCLWHNRMAQALAANGEFVRTKWPCAGMCAMISASRDGALLARLVEPFGVVPIRGSASRRGAQALLEATTWMERNYSITITPDGPRGPAYTVQEGIIYLAQTTGRPIIPISNYTRAKITMGSWDRFQIPLPFARCVMRYGAPFWVPGDATEEDRERLRLELEKAMMGITKD